MYNCTITTTSVFSSHLLGCDADLALQTFQKDEWWMKFYARRLVVGYRNAADWAPTGVRDLGFRYSASRLDYSLLLYLLGHGILQPLASGRHRADSLGTLFFLVVS